MKPVLFVDIDGTVADSSAWWIALYNQEHNTRFDKYMIVDYDFKKFIPGGLEKYYTDYSHVYPIEGALTALYALRSFYRIVFATAGFGVDWIQRWFPVEKKDVVQVSDKSLLHGYGLVDDYPLNLDVFDGQKFLLRQPWNTGRDLNDVTWQEITNYLLEVVK